MQTKREIIYEASKGYNKLSKKEKGRKPDNIVAGDGYNRDYASRLLSQHDKYTYVKDASGRPCKLVADVRKKKKRSMGRKI
ncbi:MAG TPA: hypothetical protein GXX72_01115 [Clostridiaceae bacterium]|nr:hypothetical protein [Clostridiaceae bacterium]